MSMPLYRTWTEQEWVFEYVTSKPQPTPVVLGSKGTWSGNGKPMIILIGFTLVDVLTLADIYDAAHHPVREMEHQGITYYAINIIEKRKVKKIIEDWK
jgi:CO dehydrogenase/acetyl-CoA synthase alpha subunit